MQKHRNIYLTKENENMKLATIKLEYQNSNESNEIYIVTDYENNVRCNIQLKDGDKGIAGIERVNINILNMIGEA